MAGMDDVLALDDAGRVQPSSAPVQCVGNPEGRGMRVYEDNTFYHTPIPQVPVQCVSNPEGYGVRVYMEKTFYHTPVGLPQEYKDDQPSPA